MSACPVCGGAAGEYLHGLESCGACGLAFANEKYLGAPVYAPGIEDDIYVSAKERLFEEALDRLEELRPAKGALLDVGCAGGELLKAAAARGWRASGVEPDPELARKAKTAGFEVSPLSVEEAMLDKAAFDAITVFEAFCLMDKPGAVLAELYSLLRPGGVIYIREFNAAFHLPLARLASAGLFRPLEMKPSVLHNFNFRERTLRFMLERVGLGNIVVRNSRPTRGDPYRTGGRLGGFLTGLLKVLYYWLAQAVWAATLGRVFIGSALIVTARK
ncbi:MAG: class I SAM-dependent methyltransferase [Elusimicrobia bacterium]|nr:class I SAM-dependent methyltransferase [Elusimicrobiota bacterium]